MPPRTPPLTAYEKRLATLRGAIDTTSAKAYAESLDAYAGLSDAERGFLSLDVEITVAEASAATARELRRLRGITKVLTEVILQAEPDKALRAIHKSLRTIEDLLDLDDDGDGDGDLDGDGERRPAGRDRGDRYEGDHDGGDGSDGGYVDEDGNPLDLDVPLDGPDPGDRPAPESLDDRDQPSGGRRTLRGAGQAASPEAVAKIAALSGHPTPQED
jgi:hypothetical protein